MKNTAISPDGRFLLNVQSDSGCEKPVAAETFPPALTQVLPASGQSFAPLVFSRGSSFYFQETAGAQQPLSFRVPLPAVHPCCLPRTWTGPDIFTGRQAHPCIPTYNDPELNKWRLLEARRRRRKRSAVCRTCVGYGPPPSSLVPDGKRVAISHVDFSEQPNLLARFASLWDFAPR